MGIGAPPRAPYGVLGAWLDHLEVERGASPHTLAAYGRDVRAVWRACGIGVRAETRDGALEKLTAPALLRWLRGERAEERAASSIGRRLAALRGFLAFARSIGSMTSDPAAGLPTGRRWERLPKVLSREAVAHLLGSLDSARALDVRDRALLELMYATGARVQEACDWRLTDLRLDDRVIRCVGKGRKERWVPLGEQAAAAVTRYLDEVRVRHDKHGAEALFLSIRGRPLDRHRIYRLVSERAARAGLPQACSPHTLRHSFATHLMAGGADLRVVQELLGHATVQTTQIYTHVDSDRLKAVHKRFHPRG